MHRGCIMVQGAKYTEKVSLPMYYTTTYSLYSTYRNLLIK